MVLAMFTIVVGNGVPIQKFQDFFHLSKGQTIDLPKMKKNTFDMDFEISTINI